MVNMLRNALCITLAAHAIAKSFDAAISSVDSLSMIYDVLVHHDMLRELGEQRNVTYFAPNNDAMIWLADFGLNLTTADPAIALAIMRYGVIDGIHTTESVAKGPDPHLVHSHMLPPLFTNVSSGQALKLRSGKRGEIVLETGLQSLTRAIEADIRFDHGIIHGTERNMVIPHNISETTNIGQLHEFLRLMHDTGMRDELEALKDVTIFIPHDDALKRYRSALNMMDVAELSAVLGSHVIPNSVLYADTVGAESKDLRTLHGSPIDVKKHESGTLLVNGISVVRQDVILLGGVAHLIDDVLFPEHKTIATHILGQNLVYSYRDILPHMNATWMAMLGFVVLTIALVKVQLKRRNRLAVYMNIETTDKDLQEKLLV